MGLGEHLLGPRHVEGQVTRLELDRVPRRAQPRQVRLLEPAGRDQLGTSGIPEIATPSAS